MSTAYVCCCCMRYKKKKYFQILLVRNQKYKKKSVHAINQIKRFFRDFCLKRNMNLAFKLKHIQPLPHYYYYWMMDIKQYYCKLCCRGFSVMFEVCFLLVFKWVQYTLICSSNILYEICNNKLWILSSYLNGEFFFFLCKHNMAWMIFTLPLLFLTNILKYLSLSFNF